MHVGIKAEIVNLSNETGSKGTYFGLLIAGRILEYSSVTCGRYIKGAQFKFRTQEGVFYQSIINLFGVMLNLRDDFTPINLLKFSLESTFWAVN
jgi:hypothetical protein